MEGKELQKQEEMMPTFAVSIEEVQKRFNELQSFIKTQMKEGEDYGKIPGCPKPSLFKPGAEKLATLYGLSPRIEVTDSTKDWEKGFFFYQVKCSLISKRTGFIVSEGLGSCNSKERRYRNQDGFTLDNTILKMAQKRAMVGATLSATRTSGLFTQDIEDGILDTNGHTADPAPAAAPAPEWDGEDTMAEPPVNKGGVPASDKQKKCIWAICKSKNKNVADVYAEYNTTENELTKADASTIIEALQK